MTPEKRTRLIQLLGMMGSAHDGEKLNAARLAMRLLGEEGLTWEEVFKGIPGSNGPDRYTEGWNDGYREGRGKGIAEGRAQASSMARPHVQTWVGFARELMAEYEDDLSDWEQGFVSSYISRGWSSPTDKQRKVFERIADKLDLECPD